MGDSAGGPAAPCADAAATTPSAAAATTAAAASPASPPSFEEKYLSNAEPVCAGDAMRPDFIYKEGRQPVLAKVVICEICLEEGPPCAMRYQGGEQWTHSGGECVELFNQHLRSVDQRSVRELVHDVLHCGRSLDTFTREFGGDREYSVRALQEERSQAMVALLRRLRVANHAVLRAPYAVGHALAEEILAFSAGALRTDMTPVEEAVECAGDEDGGAVVRERSAAEVEEEAAEARRNASHILAAMCDGAGGDVPKQA